MKSYYENTYDFRICPCIGLWMRTFAGVKVCNRIEFTHKKKTKTKEKTNQNCNRITNVTKCKALE